MMVRCHFMSDSAECNNRWVRERHTESSQNKIIRKNNGTEYVLPVSMLEYSLRATGTKRMGTLT